MKNSIKIGLGLLTGGVLIYAFRNSLFGSSSKNIEFKDVKHDNISPGGIRYDPLSDFAMAKYNGSADYFYVFNKPHDTLVLPIPALLTEKKESDLGIVNIYIESNGRSANPPTYRVKRESDLYYEVLDPNASGYFSLKERDDALRLPVLYIPKKYFNIEKSQTYEN